MTALSTLPAAGAITTRVRVGALSTLADHLIAHKRAGTPFEAAWNDAVARTRGLHAYTQADPDDPDAPSPLDFARVRFAAAYRNDDYNRPTCKTGGCVELAYRGGQCRLHCPVDGG